MAKVIIFGIKDTAELAQYYLNVDSEHDVVAFSLNEEFIDGIDNFNNSPVIPFEDIENAYDPSEYKFFAPMTYRKMNRIREQVFSEIKSKGYECISYISSKCTKFENIPIGENCFILEDNTLQPFTEIGNNVVLWSGNHIGHHSKIGDNSFFTSHVVLSGNCQVGNNCFFGVNSTVKDGVTLGEGTYIAMSSSVVNDTEPWSVYKGSFAKKASISSKILEY